MRVNFLPFLAGSALLLAGCTKDSTQPAANPPAANPPAASPPAASQPVYAKAPDPSGAAQPAAAQPAAAAPAKLDQTKYDHFGAGIAATTKATPLADVVKNPDAFTGKPVAIEATVGDVCPKKGCWMKLGAPAAMHVTFKDYGFFVPLDASGRTAIVEGSLAKKDEKLMFVATGVAMTKPPAK